MSTMAESKVSEIVKSLSALEDDLDSLNSKVADMKKQLSVKAQTEIDTLLEKHVKWLRKRLKSSLMLQKNKQQQNLQKSTKKEIHKIKLKFNLQ